jgi:hypothetical protein
MDPMILLQVDWPLGDVWGSAIGFIALFILFVAAIGLLSKSLAVAAMGAYLTFAYYATETDLVLLETVLYVTLTLLAIGVAFKLWRSEGVGDI